MLLGCVGGSTHNIWLKLREIFLFVYFQTVKGIEIKTWKFEKTSVLVKINLVLMSQIHTKFGHLISELGGISDHLLSGK